MLGRHVVRQAESGIECRALNAGKLGGARAHGSEHLMQPGEREMGLDLHPGGGEGGHTALSRRSCSVRNQPRLADTRLATEQQRLAAHRDVVQHRRQETLLLLATYQRRNLVANVPEHDRFIVSLGAHPWDSRRELAKPGGVGRELRPLLRCWFRGGRVRRGWRRLGRWTG